MDVPGWTVTCNKWLVTGGSRIYMGWTRAIADPALPDNCLGGMVSGESCLSEWTKVSY